MKQQAPDQVSGTISTTTLAMESLTQELLDAVIDYVPLYNADSCSLVARRWQKRSQKRYFSSIVFSQEYDVVRWYTNIPQDPNGIPAYADSVEFQNIRCWRDPTIFGQVLKCFSRVKTLTITDTMIKSSEVDNIVSSGEFGRELISLVLLTPWSTVPTLMPLILSFPNLSELTIDSITPVEPPVSVLPEKTWKAKPLQSLELAWLQGEDIEFIGSCGITSRRFELVVGDVMVEKIIAYHSKTMGELVLQGTWLLWDSTIGGSR